MSHPDARRARAHAFRPAPESLEGRALMAVGQISLYFPTPANYNGAQKIQGTLPDGSIDVQSFSLGLSNSLSISSQSSGIGASKASFDPLIVTMAAGPQTAAFFQANTAGVGFNSATLTVRDSAARVIQTYSIKLVGVASDSVTGTTTAGATETVKLGYGAIQVTTYNPATASIISQASWNVITNTSSFDIKGISSAKTLVSSLPASLSTSEVSAAIRSRGSVVAPHAIDTYGGISSSIPTKIKMDSQPSKTAKTTLAAKVTSPGGVPSGKVTFYAGDDELGQADVDPDGKARISVPTALLKKYKPIAVYSGEPELKFRPSSSMTKGKDVQNNFNKWLGRPMTADEWVITSIWLEQGQSPAKLAKIYKTLAN